MIKISETEAIERVKKLDLEPIVFKMMHPEPGVTGLSLEEADRNVELYRQFLILGLMHPGKQIVPTHEIDYVWHTHILDTAKYRDDCHNICGRFIDHFPYLGLRGPDDVAKWHGAFAETQLLFQQHFGVNLRGNARDCSGDECGTSCDGESTCDLDSALQIRPRPIRQNQLQVM